MNWKANHLNGKSYIHTCMYIYIIIYNIYVHCTPFGYIYGYIIYLVLQKSISNWLTSQQRWSPKNEAGTTAGAAVGTAGLGGRALQGVFGRKDQPWSNFEFVLGIFKGEPKQQKRKPLMIMLRKIISSNWDLKEIWGWINSYCTKLIGEEHPFTRYCGQDGYNNDDNLSPHIIA